MKPPRYPVPNIKLDPEDFDTKQLWISYKVEDLLIFHWSLDTYNNFSTSCHSNKGHHQKKSVTLEILQVEQREEEK